LNIEKIRQEREMWLQWKNIAPIVDALATLQPLQCRVEIDDTICIQSPELPIQKIHDIAWMMRPWRKGPFMFNDLLIDSEWRSNIKYNLLSEHINLEGKSVADIGCNNGYYMFRMLQQHPKQLVGFDPSALNRCQFDFINHFVKSPILFELLGVEHLPFYGEKFDTIFCLGVLYHRSDPVAMLKQLKSALNKNGEVILDTFMIDGDQEYVLSPKQRYSKIPNITFIPMRKALINWCYRAGFNEVIEIAQMKTTQNEQRKTQWIEGESLNDFLDPNNDALTIEGYPAPKRIYLKLKI